MAAKRVTKNQSTISNTVSSGTSINAYTTSIGTLPSATTGSVYINNSTGGLTWTSPNVLGGPFTINNGTTNAVWTTVSPTYFHNYDLLAVEQFELNINACTPFLSSSAVKVPVELAVEYPLYGKTYSIFIEQDYTDISLNALTASTVFKTNRRMSILALDKTLHRLEFTSIYADSDPKANLEHLVDDTFSVVSDKTNYISTLYCRLMPLIMYKITNTSFKTSGNMASSSISFERCVSSGITPIMHLSNVVFGGLLPPSKSEIAGIFDNLTTEVLVLAKDAFPKIQQYFSPEYGYLTLDASKDTKQIIRNWSDYTETGVTGLLTAVTIPGTNVIPFATCLLEHIGLDQQVKDTAENAVSELKRLLESF